MKFAELSEKAKERARDAWREACLNDEWWENVYADAVTCGELMGIIISDKTSNRTRAGKIISSPDIYFGIGQGGGCCYDGYLDTTKFKDAVARVKAHAPQDEKLHRLAGIAENLYDSIAAEHVAAILLGDERSDYVFLGMRVAINGIERHYTTSTEDNEMLHDMETVADKFVADFAVWIYGQLETEHDYQLADAQVNESIEAANPEFDEEGSL